MSEFKKFVLLPAERYKNLLVNDKEDESINSKDLSNEEINETKDTEPEQIKGIPDRVSEINKQGKTIPPPPGVPEKPIHWITI